MNFATSMQAKEFLVSRIVEEAARQHVSLSELEHKMLYFSEGYPTLPDIMEVNERFEAEYDREHYEEKIEELSKGAFERDKEESPGNIQLWREAIEILKKEDHYIMVMLDVPRSVADFVKLIIAGFVTVVAGICTIVAINWMGQSIHLRIPDYVKVLVLLLIFPFAYYIAYSDKGKELGDRLCELADRVEKWF